jgi:RNA polymerase sigma factor (sigma-70 family)
MKVDGNSLGKLMALAQAGEAEAYRTVLSACQSWLTRYYSGRIAPHQIDDLVQDTLISVHRKRETYDPTRPFLPWLAAIARYRWVDQLRRTYRANETELLDDIVADPVRGDVTAQVSLARLMDQIPERQAHVIRLVKIEGYSITEAALRTGQSEPLVKVNIHRGLKKLAALCEKA